MLSFLDIAERIQKGPKTDENEWNMGLFNEMNTLTEKYQIIYPEDGSFFNMDEDLADRAFQATMEFLSDNGVYCISTGRVLQFTENELATAIREIPSEITVGEGRDARVIKRRQISQIDLVAIDNPNGSHAGGCQIKSRRRA